MPAESAQDRRKALVGHNIALRRQQLGMVARVLAERIGVTTVYMSKLENGVHLPLSYFDALAYELDVPVAWFFEPHDDTGAELSRGRHADLSD